MLTVTVAGQASPPPPPPVLPPPQGLQQVLTDDCLKLLLMKCTRAAAPNGYRQFQAMHLQEAGHLCHHQPASTSAFTRKVMI